MNLHVVWIKIEKTAEVGYSLKLDEFHMKSNTFHWLDHKTICRPAEREGNSSHITHY